MFHRFIGAHSVCVHCGQTEQSADKWCQGSPESHEQVSDAVRHGDTYYDHNRR